MNNPFIRQSALVTVPPCRLLVVATTADGNLRPPRGSLSRVGGRGHFPREASDGRR
jgi:hypothetical protein